MKKTIPTLYTERLELSEVLLKDIPLITQYANNTRIAAMTLNIPYPYTEKDAHLWLNIAQKGAQSGRHLILALRHKATGAFMGGVDLVVTSRHNRAELAYWLGEPFWGQGFMTEAVSKMMEYAFEELQIQKVYAVCFDFNIGSSAVMQKAGLKYEGMMKDHMKKGDKYITTVQYGLTRDDYLKN